MNEYTMELVDRFAALLEENTELRVRIGILEKVVKAEELKDADYQTRKAYGAPDYDGSVKTDRINEIFGWDRASEAVEIVEGLRRKEADNGESV